MTWWSALGLALALYGVVVLLEWLYGQILRTPGLMAPKVSLVIRVTNQENQIEHAVRELTGLWSELDWRRSQVEVFMSDGGSTDQTPAILDRLSRDYPFLTVLEPGLSHDEVVSLCGEPVVIWAELSRAGSRHVIATVHKLLERKSGEVKHPVA